MKRTRHRGERRGLAAGNLFLAIAIAYGTLVAPVAARAETRTGLSAVQVFDLADGYRKEGRLAEAEALYRALAKDANPEYRAEARFRLGMMLADAKRYQDAALAFRALLDEKPDSPRVRIELARVLALMGDEGGARRELRQAQASGTLPPEVVLAVNQFAQALRSTRLFGGSLSVSLAPDTNINRATDAKTLETVIAPLTLSRDARERSGIGAKVGAQVFARVPIADNLYVVPRISSDADLYREERFDDISGAAAIGLELRGKRTRIQPSVAMTWRRYGTHPYTRTPTASVRWLQMSGPKAQFDTQLTVGRANYLTNDLQDGWVYSLATMYERAFDARSGGSISLALSRQDARDPGYATTWGGPSLLYWRELGKITAFGTVGVRRLEADRRLFLFPERRKEWYFQARAGGTFRQASFLGFAPLASVTFERNKSTVGIYDYQRLAFEFGLTRAF